MVGNPLVSFTREAAEYIYVILHSCFGIVSPYLLDLLTPLSGCSAQNNDGETGLCCAYAPG